jgi:UDP-N-acetylglucosamine 3-dehydrogenase
MLKGAVIGVGAIGQNHARVMRGADRVNFVGIADADPVVARRVAQLHNVPAFASLEELLEKGTPDLVTVAVPTGLHYEVGLKLIDRGIHVLMEKPIASTVEQGEELVAKAQEKGVILAVGHIERFNPAVMELRRRLREGMAGRIYKLLSQRLSPYPPRIRDAGVVIDLASHDIDLMRYLVAEPIVRLYGETLQGINSDREDMFDGLLKFQGGAVGVLDVNWMTPKKVRRLTVTGARGLFECDLLSQELFFFENESAPSQWDALSVLRGVSEGNVLGIRIQRHEPLVAEVNDFVSAVRDRREPTVTGKDGLETLRVALSFVQSGTDSGVKTFAVPRPPSAE